MSIYYNGTKISSLYYNNSKMNNVYYNGTKVLTSIDPTKSSFTEDEFIAICQSGLQSQMKVGALITLANSYQNTWEVIGVNHDGTNGTVDIMSHTNINSMKANGYYSGSDLQAFCNTTIPNAFTNSTTKSLIKTMDVVSYDTTLTGQKGKALSCTEVGYSSSYAKIEGTSYGLSNYGYRSGVTNYIWTRTRYIGGDFITKVTYVVVYTGSKYNLTTSGASQTRCGVLPVLRF